MRAHFGALPPYYPDLHGFKRGLDIRLYVLGSSNSPNVSQRIYQAVLVCHIEFQTDKMRIGAAERNVRKTTRITFAFRIYFSFVDSSVIAPSPPSP